AAKVKEATEKLTRTKAFRNPLPFEAVSDLEQLALVMSPDDPARRSRALWLLRGKVKAEALEAWCNKHAEPRSMLIDGKTLPYYVSASKVAAEPAFVVQLEDD